MISTTRCTARCTSGLTSGLITLGERRHSSKQSKLFAARKIFNNPLFNRDRQAWFKVIVKNAMEVER